MSIKLWTTNIRWKKLWTGAINKVYLWDIDIFGLGWSAETPSNWLLNNLVSAYEFDWDATDSHWSNNLTIAWATYTASGKIAWAYDFDWANDYMINTNPTWLKNTEFSISIWIKPDIITGNHMINNYHNASWRHWFYVYISNSVIYFNTVASNWWATNRITDTPTAWVWTHYVYVVKSTGCVLYKNGTQIGTQTYTTPTYDTTMSLNVWKYYTSSLYYNWLIDQKLFYSTALTSDNVTDLYNSWNWLAYSLFTT